MFRNKELALLELDELEALFAKLTPEEIELLNAECNADPDVLLFYFSFLLSMYSMLIIIIIIIKMNQGSLLASIRQMS